MINTHISNLQAIKATTMGFFSFLSKRRAAEAQRKELEARLAAQAETNRAKEAEQVKALMMSTAAKVGMQRAAETNRANMRAIQQARVCNVTGYGPGGWPLLPGEKIVPVLYDPFGYAIPPKSS